MSGWEKYVEQAAEVLASHVQVWRIWDHEERAVCLGCDWTSETEGHELSAAWALHMATLAIPVVGPLIEEDTRDRMVTAAGRALERDGGGEQLAEQLQDAADRWRAQSNLWDTGTAEQRGTALQVADAWEHIAELRCWMRHLNRADILLDAPGVTP